MVPAFYRSAKFLFQLSTHVLISAKLEKSKSLNKSDADANLFVTPNEEGALNATQRNEGMLTSRVIGAWTFYASATEWIKC